MKGAIPEGKVLVFDDDHYYMGGVLAEKLRLEGHEVVLVTPSGEVSTWTHKTSEQERIQGRLIDLDVRLETGTTLESILEGHVQLACAYTSRVREMEAGTVVMVTSRRPTDALYHELQDRIEITRIGDCDAPGTIARSVYAGHRFAREMDTGPIPDVPFRREHAMVP
jgi:dimethylamine/trimethylamine dehydrogenase